MIFFVWLSRMLSVGGCGGVGLLGRHRHLLPLHHRGRGLEDADSHAQNPRNDIDPSLASCNYVHLFESVRPNKDVAKVLFFVLHSLRQ